MVKVVVAVEAAPAKAEAATVAAMPDGAEKIAPVAKTDARPEAVEVIELC